MKKEINYRKIIYSIFIVSITLIVLIGITYAYFAGSVSSNTNSITSTETIAINYSENKDYMFSGLIPSSLENALIGASKAENKCMDDNNYYICSLYEFTVDNISNVSQDIEVYLYQQINGYTNLKYEVYETSINDSNFDNEHKVVNSTSLVYSDSQNELGTKIDGLTKTLSKVDNSVTTDSVTYTLMFYVENKDYNQSGEDGGKQIVADIHVVSKTSGSIVSNGINIPAKVGEITTQTKYYLEDSTTDFIAVYSNYAIVNISGLDANHIFVGLNCDDNNYIFQTKMASGIDRILMSVSNDGNTLSFTGPTGLLTFNKSSDKLIVEYDTTYGLYVNVPYYDDYPYRLMTHLSLPEGVYSYYATALIKDDIYYIAGMEALSTSNPNDLSYNNLIWEGGSEPEPDEVLENYTISNNGRTLTNNNSSSYDYGNTYSIRD